MTTQLQQIITALGGGLPNSREAMLRHCKIVLGANLISIVDSHNTASVIFIFRQGIRKYVLKVEYGQNSATTREAKWYETLRDHPLMITPRCLYTFTGDRFSFLVLAYIEDARTLEDVIVADTSAAKDILSYVDDILEKDIELYLNSKPKKVSLDTMDGYFLKKFNQRLKESRSFAYLVSLYNAENIVINGTTKIAPISYIKKIATTPTLRAYLTPTQAGLVHGDLHCGNILITQSKTYLVDPNGSLLRPIEYDYGKLLHSVHGSYGQIMRGSYTLREDDGYGFEFTVSATQTHEAVFTHLKKKFTDQDMLRGLYAEAMHFSTMLPHHATNRQETIALFLRSTELFEELFSYLGMGLAI